MKPSWLAALLLTAGCHQPVRKVTLRVELAPELAPRVAELRLSPAVAELSRVRGRGTALFDVKRAARAVELVLPGACPLKVDLAQPEAKLADLRLVPLFDLGPEKRVIGLAAPFEIAAKPNCAAAQAATISFTQTAGPPLEALTRSDDGRLLRGRTSATPPAKHDQHGIVPVSARDQRELSATVRFEARLPSGETYSRNIELAPVARSSGLADVGLGHPVLLNGDDYQLDSKPEGSHAELRRVGSLLELTPDVPGNYHLDGMTNVQLVIQSGRYDEMQLDCGRAECHRSQSQSAALSPMTRVLLSDLGGCHELGDPSCATACHTTGEPGTPDGGFSHVAAEMALPALPLDHDELPMALRRLGGVGCLACHGPAKIPAPGTAPLILQNDVCAVCHDAPPRYGHVLAFETTRMAQSDSSPRARSERACARCHTSWGALGRPAPSDSHTRSGIGCSTCHDPHPTLSARTEQQPRELPPSLLRELPVPDTLANLPPTLLGPSRVCLGCHAPSSRLLRPEASAAALLAGVGGQVPPTGEPLVLPSPHAAAPKGCLTCHSSGPSGLTLGKTHGFSVDSATCKTCHKNEPARDGAIFARARELLQKLDPEHAPGNVAEPWHSRFEQLLPTPERTRALQNILLVLEDPAADVHHPAYAKALLDSAERVVLGAAP